MDEIKNSLWVEKYRPSSLDTYIGNEHLNSKVEVYLESGDLPHLLFYGKAGTGKTTLAKLLVKNIECDYIYINASDENNVDTVRTKVKNFASTVGFKDFKIYNLDVIEVPTFKPMIREDKNELVFKSEKVKYHALSKLF